MEWQRYPNFQASEFNQKDLPDFYMDEQVVDHLQYARTETPARFIIHEGYAESGHSENSYHYIGRAVDLHIRGYSLLEQALVFYRYCPFAIGLYPGWNNPGCHVDNRELPIYWIKLGKEYRYYMSFADLIIDYIDVIAIKRGD